MVGQSLARDVLGELLDHGRVLLHGDHRAWDQLAVLARGEVPRPDPHQVVKGELQDQPALRHHLKK